MDKFRYAVDRFVELLRESVIVQGLLTLGFAGTYLGLAIAGKNIPSELSQGLWVVLGFWFGVKVQHGVDLQSMRRMR